MTYWRTILLAAAASLLCFGALAQQSSMPYVRWAELEVNVADVGALRAAGLANSAASIAGEPGVVAIHSAVQKDDPGRMRVLEIYANAEAYKAHVQAAHFQRFIKDTHGIVRRQAVFETKPVLLGAKSQFSAASTSSATHVRVAELTIDPARLSAYQAAVTEEINDSIRLEPGVLAIYCVALKDRPSHLRFFEVYADESAYRRHIASAHFKTYVDATKSMIVERKLFEMASPNLSAKTR